MKTLLVLAMLVAAIVAFGAPASAGCPSQVSDCDEEARELVDFLTGSYPDCWDPDHPLFHRFCWAP